VVKVVRVKGIIVKAGAVVIAPKKRFGLRCYDKSICQVDYCKEVDTIIREPVETLRGYSMRGKIIRQPCDKDCPRRINLDKVSVKVCVNCDFLSIQEGDRLLHIPPAINCLKYIEEARGKHKPTPYSRDRRIYRRGAVGGWHYRDV
jgi:hypothetical protein